MPWHGVEVPFSDFGAQNSRLHPGYPLGRLNDGGMGGSDNMADTSSNINTIAWALSLGASKVLGIKRLTNR
jgi:hypothetical protein